MEAKTIKEMADEYAHNRYSVRSNILFASECYEDGANAVFVKIEYHLSKINVDNHSSEDLEDLYDNLCEMVKNFKGE